MDSKHLSVDEFLNRLTALFETRRQKAHGSIHLTQKRLTPSDLPAPTTPLPASSPFPDLHPPYPLPVLIRASDAKSQEKRKDRVKISTIVQPDELEKFFVRYAEIWKTGMSGLKKRDRSGRKAKAKKTKKKAKAEEDPMKV
ncbi:hypothetical protein ACLMJK_000396 [Lecanora helva]